LRRIAHRSIDPLELVVQLADAAAAVDRLVDDRPPRHLLDVLAEVADRELLRNRDVAFVGDFFAGAHAEARRLAGPVPADEPAFLAGVSRTRRVAKRNLPAVLLADAGQRDHSG